MRARRLLVPLVGAAMVFAAVPAQASTAINIMDSGFAPAFVSKSPGTVFVWHNASTSTSHSAVRTGFLGWNTGAIAPGANSVGIARKYPGTYKYECSNCSTPTGAISIKPVAFPTAGTTSTTFKIRVASVNSPSGYVYDIQMTDVDGVWSPWKTTHWRHKYFTPPGIGDYQFRARTRKTSSGAANSYSTRTVIHVT